MMSKASKLIELLEMADSIYTLGDKVIVRNAKQYDIFLPSNEVTGEVMFMTPDDRVAVKVGTGQITADPDDVSLIDDKQPVGICAGCGETKRVSTDSQICLDCLKTVQ
jgi:hypothetical protein